MKYRNTMPGMEPPEYEVSKDGVVLGTIRKLIHTYLQFGTSISWRPYLPDGTRIDHTFNTRSAAADYLEAMQR